MRSRRRIFAFHQWTGFAVHRRTAAAEARKINEVNSRAQRGGFLKLVIHGARKSPLMKRESSNEPRTHPTMRRLEKKRLRETACVALRDTALSKTANSRTLHPNREIPAKVSDNLSFGGGNRDRNMKLERRIKTTTAWGQLFVGVAALALVFFAYRAEPTSKDVNVAIEHIFYAVFFLYASGLVVDRIGDVARTLAQEKQEEEFEERSGIVAELVCGRNDLVTFPNAISGLQYCVNAVREAVSVKNTILRFGQKQSHSPQDEVYQQWVAAKRTSVESNTCTWSEIISCHIPRSSDLYKIIEPLAQKGSRYHSYRTIDDKTMPMVQMTIFEYRSGYREILFGWEFPGHPQGHRC